jgi:hypothetical protein
MAPSSHGEPTIGVEIIDGLDERAAISVDLRELIALAQLSDDETLLMADTCNEALPAVRAERVVGHAVCVP